MWFPAPTAPADIRLAGPSAALSAEELFELLQAPDRIEWREKVGVVGPRDGSAKSSTRLVASRSWVLKTNLDLAATAPEPLLTSIAEARRLQSVSAFWHPSKVWAVYRSDESWYPLSAAPELKTLRGIDEIDDRFRAWTAMLEQSVQVAQKNGVGLDLNPSNFGFEAPGGKLYYLDDEWYPSLSFAELASAAVGRIPEEPDVGDDRWRAWGGIIYSVLEPLCPSYDHWSELWDKVSTHPVAHKFERGRSALLDGLRAAHPEHRARQEKLAATSGRSEAPKPSKTAILADVHGNLVALETVLELCREMGVDSYLFLGDAVGYGPQPRECVRRLAELPNAQYVRGNHDHAIGTGVMKEGMNSLARACADWTYDQLDAGDRQWLLDLPLDIKSQEFVAVHGAPKDPRRFLAYVYELTFQDNLDHMDENNLRLCFCGHTHVQYIHDKPVDGQCRKLGAPERTRVSSDRLMIVNPGSVGQPRDGDARAAFAIWDREENLVTMHRAEYDVERVVRVAAENDLPSRYGERLREGR